MAVKLKMPYKKILKRTKHITGVVTPKAMPGRKKGRT